LINIQKRAQTAPASPSLCISSLLFLLLLLISLAAIATAQVDSASLNGVVQDSTGAAVPGAVVTLENTLSGTPRVVTSNGAGAFSFAAVPSGDYNLKVVKTGFSNFVQNGIHLDPGDSSQLVHELLGGGRRPEILGSELVGHRR